MILFFDTETTGFVKDRLPVDHPDQPYVVQLAAQLCRDNGAILAGFSTIVRLPDGVTIPKQASDVHGITDDAAAQFGVSSGSALEWFSHLYGRTDLLCAHNFQFDRRVIETMIARHYARSKPLRKPFFCTMEASAPIINLPPTERMVAAGINKPKSPKLEECIRHFFGEDLDDAHDAMVDVVACRRVYFHLRARQAETAPA